MTRDQDLKTAILTALEHNPRVDHAHVGVTVDDGIVTLTGRVESQFARVSAVDIVRRSHGVKGIADDIEVRIAGGEMITDDQLAAAIRKRLEQTTCVPDDTIGIEVRDGFVRLTGSVDWPYQRLMAAQQVDTMRGVTCLTNVIRVTQKPSLTDIACEIRRVLRDRADVEDERVTAQAEDGVVYLSGTLPVLADRDRVENAVWQVRGVTDVVNNISVGE